MNQQQYQEAQRIQPIGASGIEACRRIVQSGPEKVNAVLIDAYSASGIVRVYEGLNEVNRAKLEGMPVAQVVDVVFTLINRVAA